MPSSRWFCNLNSRNTLRTPYKEWMYSMLSVCTRTTHIGRNGYNFAGVHCTSGFRADDQSELNLINDAVTKWRINGIGCCSLEHTPHHWSSGNDDKSSANGWIPYHVKQTVQIEPYQNQWWVLGQWKQFQNIQVQAFSTKNKMGCVLFSFQSTKIEAFSNARVTFVTQNRNRNQFHY